MKKLKKLKKLTSLSLAALILLGTLAASIPSLILPVSAATGTYECYGTIHDVPDNEGYLPSHLSNMVSETSSGHLSLGRLTITGDVTRERWNSYGAFGINGGNVSFEFRFSSGDNNVGIHDWNLSSDTNTAIAGHTVGEIGTGGIIVLRSFNGGKTWEEMGASMVNMTNATTFKFTPNGADVGRGVLLRFVAAREMVCTHFSHREGWLFKKDVYVTHYSNEMAFFEVYLASNTATIGLFNKITDEADVKSELDAPDLTPEQVEILRLGSSLRDGSVSLNEVRIDTLGNSSFDVDVSHNGGDYYEEGNGTVLRDHGHYKVRVRTQFGKEDVINLWILDPGQDLAYGRYFGNSFIDQSTRIFHEDSELPVYMKGTKLHLYAEDHLPALYGQVIRYDFSGNNPVTVADFNGYSGRWDHACEEGIYVAHFEAGNRNATGEVITYTFEFIVIDDPDYRPYVNKGLLNSPDRKGNLVTRVYTVSLGSAGGGSYLFEFPATKTGYDQALAFAEELELRFIENHGEEWYYYKNLNHSGPKTIFKNKADLYAAVHAHAQENVTLEALDHNDVYATMTLEKAVEAVEKTSISQDVRVVTDEAVRASLVADLPLLNGFSFEQAAVFETESVVLKDSKGNTIKVPYGVPVEKILSASGLYTVVEDNWHGSTEYQALFFAEGAVTACLELAVKDGTTEDRVVVNNGNTPSLNGYHVEILAAEDTLDEHSILIVDSEAGRRQMLLSEAKGLVLNEEGAYRLTIKNRLGNSISCNVIIGAAPTYTISFRGAKTSTVTFGQPVGELPALTRYGYRLTGWEVEGEILAEDTLYTWPRDVFTTPVMEPVKVPVLISSHDGLKHMELDFDSVFTPPEVSAPVGHVFKGWEVNGQYLQASTFKIATEEPIVLEAVYRPLAVYNVTFIANGTVVATVPYTEGDTSLPYIPAVPQLPGMVGEWEPFALADQDLDVYALYAPLNVEEPAQPSAQPDADVPSSSTEPSTEATTEPSTEPSDEEEHVDTPAITGAPPTVTVEPVTDAPPVPTPEPETVCWATSEETTPSSAPERVTDPGLDAGESNGGGLSAITTTLALLCSLLVGVSVLLAKKRK